MQRIIAMLPSYSENILQKEQKENIVNCCSLKVSICTDVG